MTEPKANIRFCVNNPRSLAERNALLAQGHECLGCLGNCSRCFETRFLEINGRLVEGDSYEQILDRAQRQPPPPVASDPAHEKTPREDRGASEDHT